MLAGRTRGYAPVATNMLSEKHQEHFSERSKLIKLLPSLPAHPKKIK